MEGEADEIQTTKRTLHTRHLHQQKIKPKRSNTTTKPVRRPPTKPKETIHMPNLLNETLRAIKNTKAVLHKELNQTNDEHQKQKLEHQIHCLNKEETTLLKQIEQ